MMRLGGLYGETNEHNVELEKERKYRIKKENDTAFKIVVAMVIGACYISTIMVM